MKLEYQLYLSPTAPSIFRRLAKCFWDHPFSFTCFTPPFRGLHLAVTAFSLSPPPRPTPLDPKFSILIFYVPVPFLFSFFISNFPDFFASPPISFHLNIFCPCSRPSFFSQLIVCYIFFSVSEMNIGGITVSPFGNVVCSRTVSNFHL